MGWDPVKIFIYFIFFLMGWDPVKIIEEEKRCFEQYDASGPESAYLHLQAMRRDTTEVATFGSTSLREGIGLLGT